MLAHEISHVGNRDILIGSVAAAVAMGITFIANMAMFGAIFGGGGDDDDGNPIALLAMAILAPRSPPASCRWRSAAAASSRPTAPAPS